MAKIDTINIRGNTDRCVNLTHSVGLGGKNLRQDVLLIQSLFQYLYNDGSSGVMHVLPGIDRGVFGLKTEYFPRTGKMDIRTYATIVVFQQMNMRRLLSSDSKIHPASYAGRTIRSTTEPLMMITYLHVLARRFELRFASHFGGTTDYIQVLKKIAPELHI